MGVIVFIVGLVSAADLGSKELVSRTVSAGDRAGPLHPVSNEEFSLGIARTDPTLMVVLMLVGIIAGATWLLRLVRDRRVSSLAAGLALGGAIANTGDRMLNGAVRDYLLLGPVVINPADIAVVVGLILATYRYRRTRHA